MRHFKGKNKAMLMVLLELTKVDSLENSFSKRKNKSSLKKILKFKILLLRSF